MSEQPNIIELAIAAWRLEKWLENLRYDRKMAAKSALRAIKKYLTDSQIIIVDPIGSKFDPGLSVEVISNNSECADEESLFIVETITPYVYLGESLAQSARVIVGDRAKSTTTNDGTSSSTIESCDEEAMLKADDGSDDITASANGFSSAEFSSPDENEGEQGITANEIERVMAYAKIL